MTAGYCIVCERAGAWGRGLKRILSREHAIVLETRSLEECEDQVAAHPSSIVLLVGSDLAVLPLFDFLCRVSVRCDLAMMVLVAPMRWNDGIWWMREAGVAHVVSSIGQLSVVGRIVSRYRNSLPPVEMTTSERVASRLPWTRLPKQHP